MDGGTSTAAHLQNLCVLGGKRGMCMPRWGACHGRKGEHFKWSSGVFDLTVNVAQAHTRGTGNQRDDPGPRG